MNINDNRTDVLCLDSTYIKVHPDAAGALMKEQGFIPVVPQKKNRKQSWKYDKELHKCRNEIERYFCHLKRCMKIFTCYDKLDIIFTSIIQLAMIFDALLM